MKSKLNLALFTLTIGILFTQCSGNKEATKDDAPPPKRMVAKSEAVDPMDNIGIGPVKSITLDEAIDETMAEEGKVLFESLCTSCHKITKRFIGPSPKDILKRRSPEWVMNMIMNPDVMILEDPIAKQLLMEANGAPMSNQNVSEEDARKILEYFRTL
jgi:cytochrome c